MARVPTEASRLIKNSELSRLLALKKISGDEELNKELVALLGDIMNMAQVSITRSAGVPNSMDEMVGISISQAFQKGRISAVVLVNAMLKNASNEIERRESKK